MKNQDTPAMAAVGQENECKKCMGDNYVALMCCNGRECGCMGLPTDFEPCEKCNKDESKSACKDLTRQYPFFFKELEK